MAYKKALNIVSLNYYHVLIKNYELNGTLLIFCVTQKWFKRKCLSSQTLTLNSETAYKPGSVHSRRRSIIIRLGLGSLLGSSNLPGSDAGHTIRNPIWSCSGWSLPCNQLLPVARCALTAPFHPYRSRRT